VPIASRSLNIEWMSQDAETLAHTCVLRVAGRIVKSPLQAASSPHRSFTKRELQKQSAESIQPYSPLIVAGETLKLKTLQGVGYDREVTDNLLERLKAKVVRDKITLSFPRIPSGCTDENGRRVAPPEVDELRASALVGVQLDANADLITPPMPYGIMRKKDFLRILERTRIELQTFRAKQEMVGFIPTTDNLELVRDMVREYAKHECRFFAVDFSGASNQPSLMRTIVRTIRGSLHIKSTARESDEKYYLHIFDVATSRKSISQIAPISDLIVHPYGVDSTSGQMWGAPVDPDPSKLRYYLTDDYGAYRKKAIIQRRPECRCPVCRAYSIEEMYDGEGRAVLDRLREHRLHSYTTEYREVADRISDQEPARGYVPYLYTKKAADGDIRRILEDVKEIRAGL